MTPPSGLSNPTLTAYSAARLLAVRLEPRNGPFPQFFGLLQPAQIVHSARPDRSSLARFGLAPLLSAQPQAMQNP